MQNLTVTRETAHSVVLSSRGQDIDSELGSCSVSATLTTDTVNLSAPLGKRTVYTGDGVIIGDVEHDGPALQKVPIGA